MQCKCCASKQAPVPSSPALGSRWQCHGMARQIAHVLPVATAPDTEAAGASGIDLLTCGVCLRPRGRKSLSSSSAPTRAKAFLLCLRGCKVESLLVLAVFLHSSHLVLQTHGNCVSSLGQCGGWQLTFDTAGSPAKIFAIQACLLRCRTMFVFRFVRLIC